MQPCHSPDSKVHGTNMGPTWVLSAQDGPHVSPINIAIRVNNVQILLYSGRAPHQLIRVKVNITASQKNFHTPTWWRHQIEPFSALQALCAGNSKAPENSPYGDQWRGTLMFSLICVWINDWVNTREAGDLRHPRGHYDVNILINAPHWKPRYAMNTHLFSVLWKILHV